MTVVAGPHGQCGRVVPDRGLLALVPHHGQFDALLQRAAPAGRDLALDLVLRRIGGSW